MCWLVLYPSVNTRVVLHSIACLPVEVRQVFSKKNAMLTGAAAHLQYIFLVRKYAFEHIADDGLIIGAGLGEWFIQCDDRPDNWRDSARSLSACCPNRASNIPTMIMVVQFAPPLSSGYPFKTTHNAPITIMSLDLNIWLRISCCFNWSAFLSTLFSLIRHLVVVQFTAACGCYGFWTRSIILATDGSNMFSK